MNSIIDQQRQNSEMNKPAITTEEKRKLPIDHKWEPLTYVDATPDEDYPLRILQAHLDNSIPVWTGDDELCRFMNELQEKRAKILRETINKLKNYGIQKQ